ncbi:MAG: 23S rRNA (guanosine-2'-O-)-methyltransferase RlmB [Acidobacteria bacterium]|nr:23S rRNA (guanosine-2'-O-)-methyltransferase RlmB [Acidobacteriota bacterium]
MIITSPANERLKHARRVRDGRERGLIFVEGERLIEELLQSGLKPTACFHAPDPNPRAQMVVAEMARRNIPLYSVTDAALATVSDTVNSQGLVAIAEKPVFKFDQILPARDGDAPLIVCLDSVQDPGNFGTIVRTSEAAGASCVVALKGSVDAFSPKTLRSSMGSAFRLPVVTEIEVEELLAGVHAKNMKIAAAEASGETVYSDYDWRKPTMIIFGNEARGVGATVLERCDARLRIPLRAPVESLNVAAAAAAVLFEAVRQRRGTRGQGDKGTGRQEAA